MKYSLRFSVQPVYLLLQLKTEMKAMDICRVFLEGIETDDICEMICLVFNHLRDHEGWPHHEPLTATDICLPQLSTVVQLTTLSKM